MGAGDIIFGTLWNWCTISRQRGARRQSRQGREQQLEESGREAAGTTRRSVEALPEASADGGAAIQPAPCRRSCCRCQLLLLSRCCRCVGMEALPLLVLGVVLAAARGGKGGSRQHVRAGEQQAASLGMVLRSMLPQPGRQALSGASLASEQRRQGRAALST